MFILILILSKYDIDKINLLSKLFKISKFKTSGQGFTLNLMALKSFQHFG